MAPPSPTLPPRAAFLHAVAFFAGAATMMAEIAGGRLIAPFFGTSTMVWALLIGAVLGSMAVGQVLSARWLDAHEGAPLRGVLSGLLLASALLLAVLPLVASSLMGRSLSWFLHAKAGSLIASFVTVTGLLALPLVALGASGPVLLQMATDRPGATSGGRGGRLYAWGTAGSLAGTYASGLVLVPWLGTRMTFWLAAGALAGLSAVGWYAGSKRIGALVLAAAIPLVAVASPRASVKADDHVLHEQETHYQFVQVVQRGSYRSLRYNDGYAVQSILHLDGRIPTSGVWGYYALAPAWTTRGSPRSALIIGLGGGTSARTYSRLYPAAAITGIELDPSVVDIGRRFFELPDTVRVITDDARAALNKPPLNPVSEPFDVILIDAFQFPYVPFQLTTLEFFRSVERQLAPGGAVVVNVGRDEDARAVVDAIGRAMQEVFPVVRGVDVASLPNTIVVATRHDPSQDAGISALQLPVPVARELAALPPIARLVIPADTPVWTDDLAPVESVTDRIVLRRLLAQFGNRSRP